MKYITTEKGTDLPIRDLKGKDYLDVAWRLVWFRELHPSWTIRTVWVEKNKDYAHCKAEILDESGRLISDGDQDCYVKEFKDHVAKAQTSAIGRALNHAGVGTAHAIADSEEGMRISDAPIESEQATVYSIGSTTSASDYVVKFGKKYIGKSLETIGRDDVRSFRNYLIESAQKENKLLTGPALEFVNMADLFLDETKPIPTFDEPA